MSYGPDRSLACSWKIARAVSISSYSESMLQAPRRSSHTDLQANALTKRAVSAGVANSNASQPASLKSVSVRFSCLRLFCSDLVILLARADPSLPVAPCAACRALLSICER